MEMFCFEEPSIQRKDEAISYVKEFYEHNSEVYGVGGLDKYLDNYEGWLRKLEEDYKRQPSEDRVPARTYFLIRKSDDKIIGMINIRLALNENLKKYGGNIGYSIRPNERGHGYNEMNLYLGLKVCDQYGLSSVLLDVDIDNPASWRTIEALDGKKLNEHYDYYGHCMVARYAIDVQKSLCDNSGSYEEHIYDGKTR